MNKIYQVLSNLNHNGTIHKIGAFIEGAGAAFEKLVESKTIRLIEGAQSIEHAAELVGAQSTAETAVASEVKEPENTWGPKPDPKPADAEPELKTATPEAIAEQKAHDESTDTQTGAPEAPKEATAPAKSLDEGLNL